jgi:hypothetical protein
VSEIAYVSKVHIERKAGPLRIANLPGESQPVSSASMAPTPSITRLSHRLFRNPTYPR